MKTFWVIAAVAGVSSSLVAETFTAAPAKDNTLFQSIDGSTSNGAGGSIFAGTTNVGELRRALLQFDLSDIPHGSFVTGATLRITKDRQGPGGAPSLAVHRVTQAWGEGTSLGSGGGGAATNGDATWIHRIRPGSLWTTPGGDFDPTVLSSLTASATGNQTFASSAAFVGAVQSWISGPQFNFGLIVKESTSVVGAAARFYSREATDASVRPLLTVSFDRPTSTWTADADGNWNAAGSWMGGVPDGFGVVARFGGNITAPRTVTNTSNVRVGQLSFDSAQPYTIAGPGQITLDNGNGYAARIDVLAGSHRIDAPMETNRTTAIAVATASSVRLGSFSALSAVTKTGAGNLQVGAGFFNALTIEAGRVTVDSASPLQIGTLGLTGGTLDVQQYGMIVASSAGSVAADLAARTADIVAGRIETTRAGLLVGIARSDELGLNSFMGSSLSGPSVLVRGTLAGDTNLDAAVNFDDLLSLAQNYGTLTGAAWTDGDSNRDGKVDFDDLLALAQRYGSSVVQEGQISVDVAVQKGFASDWQRALSIVPEPSLAFAAVMMAPCLPRRR